MHKSISIGKMFAGMDFYERLKAVKAAGFDYVEFAAWSHLDIPRVKEAAAEAGVRIACFSGDEKYSIVASDERRAFLEALERALEAAAILDCRNLYIHSNAIDKDGVMSPSAGGASVTSKIAAATRVLMEAAPLAMKAGVVLQVEPISHHVFPGYFFNTTESAAEIIRVVDSPNVRLLYDVFHMQMTEGDFTHVLRRYADVLGYVHVADAPDRHEPGTGEISFSHFKQVLAEIGYDGFIGFELTPRGDVEECLRVLREF